MNTADVSSHLFVWRFPFIKMSTTIIMLNSVEEALKKSRKASFGIVRLRQQIRYKAISLLIDGRPSFTFAYGPDRVVTDLSRPCRASVHINRWDSSICMQPFNLVTLEANFTVVKLAHSMVDPKKLKSGFETYNHKKKNCHHYVHAVINSWLICLPSFDRRSYAMHVCVQNELHKLITRKSMDRLDVLPDMSNFRGLGNLYWALTILVIAVVSGILASYIYHYLIPESGFIGPLLYPKKTVIAPKQPQCMTCQNTCMKCKPG